MGNSQKSLVNFGGGVIPDRSGKGKDHDSRSERAMHRRKLYDHGRCRAISKSKACRCGAGADGFAEAQLCDYHTNEFQPITIDDGPGLLARWCGTRGTEWEQIPELCREALEEMGANE